MKSTLFAPLFVLAGCLVGLVCPLPTANLECLNAFAPATNARGVNRLDRNFKKPLFRLQITPSEDVDGSQDESWTYKVHMTVENELLPFSDAKISIEGRGPCGSGSLTFDPHHFLEAKQTSPSCPRLLLTNRKQPMTELPSLLWTPPSCGCVHFRVLVIEGGSIYYADNGDMDSGPLSQTVCVHKQATREQHLDALCHVRERYTAAEIMSRPSFLSRHQLETRWMDRHGIEMALELRRSDSRHCCNQKTKDSKKTCFEDMRRRRVDSFCEDGYPDIPFSSFRLTHMREKEKTCCYNLGERRYSCFASDSELVSGPTVTVLDFSQDETDPVNDLPEFASVKDVDIVQRLRYVTFETNELQNDSSEEEEDQKNDNDDILSRDNKENKLKNNDKAKKKDIAKESKHQKQTEATSDVEAKKHTNPKDLGAFDETRSAQFLTEDRLMLPQHLDIMERQPPSETLTTEDASIFERPAIAMTSAERRKLRRNGSFRKDRRWSREHLDTGRTASREFFAAQRRVSAELAGKRQISAERGLVPSGMERWLPGYEEPFERGTGLSREADLMSSVAPRLSSSERRMGKSSAQRRDGRLDGAGVLNFDDQGGASVEETLIKLQRKMERLHLKRECCEAGAMAGKHVYGKFTQTWNECGHSADKFVLKSDLFSGTRVCMEQFRKCCVEQAVSGPVMTSSEFREAEFMYLNNLERLDPTSEFDHLERKEREPARAKPDEAASGLHRRVPGKETPEDYEKESERRFKSMRTEDEVDKYEDDEEEEEDDYDGPRQFDETDNDDDAAAVDGFDLLDRKHEAPKKSSRKSTAAEDEVEDFDDRTFVGNDEDDEMDFEDKNDKTSVPTKKETDLEVDETRKRHHHRKHDLDDQLDRRTDHFRKGASQIAETSRDYERSLLASRSSRRFRNSREGRTSKGRRFRSGSSRRRSSRKRSSRLTSRERRLLASSALSQPALYKPKPVPYGKVGALDSQEMAAVHFKGVVGALDSKEMAKAYRGRRHEAENDDFQRDDFFSRTGSAPRHRRRYFKRYY